MKQTSNANFLFVFGRSGLSEVAALSHEYDNASMARKDFNEVHDYLKDWGKAEEGYPHAKLSKKNDTHFIWSDFPEDWDGLCHLEWVLQPSKSGKNEIFVHIIYKNSPLCRTK